MIDKDKVFNFVKLRGPVLPRDISREFKQDTFITGAVLSSLVEEKKLKISHAKIGGSPVYYAPEQEEKLSILYKYLPGKEKEAYDLLKDQKIIKESECEPAIRVALRNIKDFAKPLEVNINQKREIFWKWHLINNNETENLIKKKITGKTEDKKSKENENYEKEKYEEDSYENDDRYENNKKVISEKIKEDKKENAEDSRKENMIQQKLIEKSNIENENQKKEKQEDVKKDLLLLRLEKLFSEKEIEILEYKIIRKKSDIELLVNINSPVGKLKYFCKARDKKTNNDKDLSAVYVQGQMKKLPVLYVTTGELTKKAKELLESEFKLISVLKI